MNNWYEKHREELRKRGNKGFTLMEMLIVVAIIAVLVAIAIPVFTTQLERSREATDMSNVRAGYAEVIAEYLANGGKTNSKTTATATARQTISGWQNPENGKLQVRINGVEKTVSFAPKTSGSYTITVVPSNSKLITVN